MTNIKTWIDEYHKGSRFGLNGDVLIKQNSQYQEIIVVENEYYGRALMLDGCWMTSLKDEKYYHECLVHPALSSIYEKSNVLIIGGGDGGVARACLENNSNYIDWFELDPEIVDVCYRHLPKVCSKVKKSNKIKTFWGDAFKSIKEIEDSKYDKIFVDLNDDQYCIDLAKKNMKGLKRILKKGGVITAQVGSQDKKPKQVDNWCKVLEKSFGNVKLSGAYIPSFDCKWNFASSIMK